MIKKNTLAYYDRDAGSIKSLKVASARFGPVDPADDLTFGAARYNLTSNETSAGFRAKAS